MSTALESDTTDQMVALNPAKRAKRPRKVKDDAAVTAGPLWAILAWTLTLLFFAPVAWMVLTSLHTEADAATNPPSIFAPLTFSNYAAVFDRGIATFALRTISSLFTEEASR